MEGTVTISMDRYNELINAEQCTLIYPEDKIYVRKEIFTDFLNCKTHELFFVSKKAITNDIIKSQEDRIKEQSKQIIELVAENLKLKHTPSKKGWFRV